MSSSTVITSDDVHIIVNATHNNRKQIPTENKFNWSEKNWPPFLTFVRQATPRCGRTVGYGSHGR